MKQSFKKHFTPYNIIAIIIMIIAIIIFSYHSAFYLQKKYKEQGFGKTDYAVFYVAGASITRALDISPDELYTKNKIKPAIKSVRAQNGGTKFLYPPQAAIFFSPLTIFPFNFSFKIWALLNALFYISAFYIGILFFDKKFYKIRYSLILLLLTFANTTFTLFKTGQINGMLWLFFMLSLYILYKNKTSILSGILLAISIILKVFPVFFMPYLFLKRKWLALGSAIIFIILLFIGSYAFFTNDTQMYYAKYVFKDRVLAGSVGHHSHNTSLYGTLYLHTKKDGAFLNDLKKEDKMKLLNTGHKIITLLVLGFISYLLFKTRKQENKLRILFDYGLIITFILLFSKSIHSAYNLFLIPIAIYLFYLWDYKKYWPLAGILILWTSNFWAYFPISKDAVWYIFCVRNSGLIILFCLLITTYFKKTQYILMPKTVKSSL